MGLTPEQIKLLEMPFALNEHDYNNDGQPYIKKSALRRRLRQVDSSYYMGAPLLLSESDDVIVMRGSLVVGSVEVWGVGTGKINRMSGDKPVTGYKLAIAIEKAHKQSASDILPRAAVELNCGAYLKDKPRDIKKDAFADWLAKLAGPSHWSAGEGRGRIQSMLDLLGMKWDDIKSLVEPGKTLSRLVDTSLSEAQFIARLFELRQPAQPKTADASH